MRRGIIAGLAALVLAPAGAQGADEDAAVIPVEGVYYDLGQVFSGPCTPAETLPAPTDNRQTAESTWTESYFQSSMEAEPWGTIAPTPKPDEEGIFPQPQNPRGDCKGDQRLTVDGFVDVVSPLGEPNVEGGQNSMVTQRVTQPSAVCNSGGNDLSQAEWCIDDSAAEHPAEIVDIVTFFLYWHCTYTVERATKGSLIRSSSGAERPAKGFAMAGETIIVPRKGRVVVESGPSRLTLHTGRYELDDPPSCGRASAFRSGVKTPPPVTPMLRSGVMEAALKGMRSFRMQTPDATIREAPAAKPRTGPVESAETAVRVERDAAKRLTKVCAGDGAVIVTNRARRKRSLTVREGGCAVVRAGRTPRRQR